MNSEQLLFDDLNSTYPANSTTFADNMKLPVHRWFRYSAGFSAEWTKFLIAANSSKKTKILDPFAGSGTTLVSSNEMDVTSFGYETHPFVNRIAKVKLNHNPNIKKLTKLFNHVITDKSKSRFLYENQPELLRKCYTEDTLKELVNFKYRFDTINDGSIESELVWLIITSILRITSHVGTAQWQYVLPNKTKTNKQTPQFAMEKKFNEIVQDLEFFQNKNIKELGQIKNHDARKIDNELKNKIDMVITSPPYPNNFDYADSTRLEMIFWGEISGWSELQSKVRTFLIRSCSQHTAAERLKLPDLLSQKEISPIQENLEEVCFELERVRKDHGGKKTYHTMIAAYYLDLAKTLRSLRHSLKEGGKMCFVIGDSAPYGVYAPADQWIGKLAIAAGFNNWEFEKTRDRNIKWKNRKHTVPLKEGRLWIYG
ncbi:site-specific DNA-methyltransferase [Leptospira sp. 85282-16]|nr:MULTISPECIES: DNA methyltransferase [Leptospira]MCT8333453.1 site-specific DNA-methyltransferase [Leptospira sp. 85282-16]